MLDQNLDRAVAPAPAAKPSSAIPASSANNYGYVPGGYTGALSTPAASSSSAAAPAKQGATGSTAGSSGTGNDIKPTDNSAQLTALQKQLDDQTKLINTLQAGQNAAAGQAALNTQITNQNALTLLQSTLAGYGIDPTGAISNAILGLQQKNYDAATIQNLIQDPTAASSKDPNVVALANAWNTRFSGNVAREKAGLTPLSPADYISTENSYKAVMARAGMDAAHMDPAVLGNLIGTDVSPAEVQQRVDAATAAVTATDPFTLQQLQQNFGLTNGDMIGHLLDPATASSVIAQKVQASQIQGEAGRQNLALNQQNAATLAAAGVTQAQAAQGFTTIGSQLGQQQALASTYNMNAGNIGNALTAATFNSNINGVSAAQAQQDLARLRAQEVNEFSGSSGASKGSLYTESQGVS